MAAVQAADLILAASDCRRPRPKTVRKVALSVWPQRQNLHMEQKHYIIRGGLEGRARLEVLSRLMLPTTLSLLDRAGFRPGMNCLEIGCGSGDVAFDLAGIVGPAGRVVATD